MVQLAAMTALAIRCGCSIARICATAPPAEWPTICALVDVKRIHQPDDIGRQPLRGGAAGREIALAHAAMVVNDDLERAGEGGDLVAPILGGAGQAGDEEDGESGAVPLVIEMAIADRNARHGSSVWLLSRLVNIGRCRCQTRASTRRAVTEPQHARGVSRTGGRTSKLCRRRQGGVRLERGELTRRERANPSMAQAKASTSSSPVEQAAFAAYLWPRRGRALRPSAVQHISTARILPFGSPDPRRGHGVPSLSP